MNNIIHIIEMFLLIKWTHKLKNYVNYVINYVNYIGRLIPVS